MGKEIFSIDFDADYLGKAREFLSAEKYQDAIDMYDKLLDDTGLIKIRDDILEAKDKNKDQLIKLWNKNWKEFRLFCVPILYEKANVFKKFGKFKKALEIYGKILDIDASGNIENIQGMGHGSQYFGEHQEAIEIYNIILKISNPKKGKVKYFYYISLYNKGVALFNLGKYNEAVKIFDQVIEVDVNDEYRVKSMAVYYKNKALEFLEKEKINHDVNTSTINSNLITKNEQIDLNKKQNREDLAKDTNIVFYFSVALLVFWGATKNFAEDVGLNTIIVVALVVFEMWWYKFCWSDQKR